MSREVSRIVPQLTSENLYSKQWHLPPLIDFIKLLAKIGNPAAKIVISGYRDRGYWIEPTLDELVQELGNRWNR